MLTHDYSICYGWFDEADSAKSFRPVIEYGNTDTKITELLKLPAHVYSDRVHRLADFPQPPRPKIIKKGNTLKVSGNFDAYTWYTLEGKNLTELCKVGVGKTFAAPKKGVVYCVEVPYGIGYSVSLPFVY